MADRRYSTARWQRLRKGILRRDNGICQIAGPRCSVVASSVHHRIPSSQAPHLFWEPSNLVSACAACNYGGGRQVAVDNSRRRTEQLMQVIEEQAQTISELLERLAGYEGERPDPGLPRTPARPAIY
jgi:hypothetical protein